MSTFIVLDRGYVNFRELRKGEVRRTHHRRASGSVKLHSRVTTLGQQGTEVQDGRSSTLGYKSRLRHRANGPSQVLENSKLAKLLAVSGAELDASDRAEIRGLLSG